MAQLFTSLLDLGGWLPASTTTPPTVTEEATIPLRTPLLDLPTDVLFLINDHLDASSSLSLKLACTATYTLFPQNYKTMRPQDKKQFLTLIERDPLGRGSYYCHPCNKLHPFQQTWGPHSETEILTSKNGNGLFNCGNRDRFSPVGNSFSLTFAHARLAMNSHLYGPEYGIPIENLCIDHSVRRDATTIHCSTSAKVMDDELFLQRTYTFAVTEADVHEFRKCTGARDFKLCEHTSFFSSSSSYRQYIPELQKTPSSGGEGLVACRKTPGSCGLCLMDYDITIEPTEDEKSWATTIKAFHQLGSCRSPDDWKWARFTEACRPHLFFPNRPNRRGTIHNPGTIRKRWVDDDSQAFETSPEASQSILSYFNIFPTDLWKDAKPFLGYWE